MQNLKRLNNVFYFLRVKKTAVLVLWSFFLLPHTLTAVFSLLLFPLTKNHLYEVHPRYCCIAAIARILFPFSNGSAGCRQSLPEMQAHTVTFFLYKPGNTPVYTLVLKKAPGHLICTHKKCPVTYRAF